MPRILPVVKRITIASGDTDQTITIGNDHQFFYQTGHLRFYPNMGDCVHAFGDHFYAAGVLNFGEDTQRFYNSDVTFIQGSTLFYTGINLQTQQDGFTGNLDFYPQLGRVNSNFYGLTVIDAEGLGRRGEDESTDPQSPSNGWINIDNALIEDDTEAESEVDGGLLPLGYDHSFYIDDYAIDATPGDIVSLTGASAQWRSRWSLPLQVAGNGEFAVDLEEKDGTFITTLDSENMGLLGNTQGTLVTKTVDIFSDITGLSDPDKEDIRLKFRHEGTQGAAGATTSAHVAWAKILFEFTNNKRIK